MSTKRITYSEGEWFAIPLSRGDYGLGLIVRGSYRTKGGLGYFFGPRYASLPKIDLTAPMTPNNAVLVAWFGDYAIINGRWPLLESSFVFKRGNWPVPDFKRPDFANPNFGWLVEYDQENPIFSDPKRLTYLPINQISSLPEEGQLGYRALEIQLSRLLL